MLNWNLLKNALLQIAKKAIIKKTGARGLRSILRKYTFKNNVCSSRYWKMQKK